MKNRERLCMLLALLTVACGTLAGCGQTGPLVLPGDAAGAPADDSSEDDEENER